MRGLSTKRAAASGRFWDHSCWKCLDGKKPCVAGNPHQCEYRTPGMIEAIAMNNAELIKELRIAASTLELDTGPDQVVKFLLFLFWIKRRTHSKPHGLTTKQYWR